MLRGIGDGTTTTAPGFVQGAELWETPSAALTAAQNAITNYSTSFSGSNLMNTLGILAVPAIILFLVMEMGKKGR